ncbi:MAG: formate--tetrahydrofolate ligase [Schleiferiaceae bacterium]
MTDLDIARSVTPQPIGEIASRLGLNPELLEPYGKTKAKIPLEALRESQGQLVLVTAISPTPAGEGKTTVTVGLTDGLNRIGERAAAALREPSLGPVFGIKGGAAGGGRSQVIPMEDINLHFTGDFAAVEKANNLLAALIDNDLQRKNRVGLDPRTIVWKRVMDMNDRALRNLVIGLGGKAGGVPRESGFNITAASEVMAILCMSRDLDDLRARFGRIYVGDTWDRQPVFATDLKAPDSMAILMRDAIKPNLVQTLEGNPAILHGGPFANIAQGTNSLIATRMALGYADWVVTEAGFGADLGAEKFLNLKSRAGGLKPSVAVLVATARALKYHGGVALTELGTPNAEAVARGSANLAKHIENLQSFGLPVVVAINAFAADTPEEHEAIRRAAAAYGVEAVLSEGWAHGGAGTADLARAVVSASKGPVAPKFTYDLGDPMEEKIRKIATQIYGADSVVFAPAARASMKRMAEIGLGELPVCMAKTQKSFTDNEKILGRPTGFDVTVRGLEVSAGAGFVVPLLGDMLRMPGLPEVPAAEHMKIDGAGRIEGLS